MTVALLIAGVLLAGLVLLSPRLLLRWYLYEVRRREVAENPDETIVTYPLA